MQHGDWPQLRYCSIDSWIKLAETPIFNNMFKYGVNSYRFVGEVVENSDIKILCKFLNEFSIVSY